MQALQDINYLPRQKMSLLDFKSRGNRLRHVLLRGYFIGHSLQVVFHR